MSKDLLSLIVVVGLAVATGVWTADPSRPDAMPSKEPRASAGIERLQPTLGPGLHATGPDNTI